MIKSPEAVLLTETNEKRVTIEKYNVRQFRFYNSFKAFLPESLSFLMTIFLKYTCHESEKKGSIRTFFAP